MKKSYFITGGTGSFGRQLISFLYKKNLAKKIVVFSRDEHKHVNMQKNPNFKDNITYIIGDVKDTAKTFFEEYSPAPFGCIFFDVDYYTSTLAAFEIFNTDSKNRLPRVACHFDDISGTNEFLGELCAIKEFNKTHETMKIAPHHMLSELYF